MPVRLRPRAPPTLPDNFRIIPKLGPIPVDRVGREDVLKILVPLGATETGRKVTAIIRQTIEWTVAKGYVASNGLPGSRGRQHGDSGTRCSRRGRASLCDPTCWQSVGT